MLDVPPGLALDRFPEGPAGHLFKLGFLVVEIFALKATMRYNRAIFFNANRCHGHQDSSQWFPAVVGRGGRT